MKERVKKWFAAYAKSHKTGDPEADAALDLKIRHTDEVAANVLTISRGLFWPDDKLSAAIAAAYFHDAGRFPQMADFGTFNDRMSCDHAALSVEAALTSGLLQGFTAKERRQILSAVAWHNKRSIPQELPEDEQPLLKLLRDADKLDILRFFCKYYVTGRENPSPMLEFGLPEADGCSEKILADLLDGRMADLADVRNLNDVRLIKLSWMYDLYYPGSRIIFLENRYIEKTLAALPPRFNYLDRQLNDNLRKIL